MRTLLSEFTKKIIDFVLRSHGRLNIVNIFNAIYLIILLKKINIFNYSFKKNSFKDTQLEVDTADKHDCAFTRDRLWF